MDKYLYKMLLRAQSDEITEHHIYLRLAAREKVSANREVLERIASDEKDHFEIWKSRTGRDVKPSKLLVRFYLFLSRLFGLTFAVKLMEKGELLAQRNYKRIGASIPEALQIMREEKKHEAELLRMLDEERLRYVGSIVLGLSDALVELTGALAGLTLALQNGRLIAMTGLITGIAASLSMSASEYLSTRTEEDHTKHPVKAALYTGTAYVLTVALLIAPYLAFHNPFLSLGLSLGFALLVILVFTFYISVAKELPFARRFFEMAGLSLTVAAVSFAIGFLVRILLNVEL
jgi:VIT1/CCC1 family predicted Fe2+/Mn2+ transporter